MDVSQLTSDVGRFVPVGFSVFSILLAFGSCTMLGRNTRGVNLWLSATLILACICTVLSFIQNAYSSTFQRAHSQIEHVSTDTSSGGTEDEAVANISEVEPLESSLDLETSAPPRAVTKGVLDSHHEVFSQSTSDGRYFNVTFGSHHAMNPNIIPHSSRENIWYITAQAYKELDDNQRWFTELICEASFRNGSLQCSEEPSILPIASTSSLHCNGDLQFFDDNIGPHDARVFYGPDAPLIMYGSQSRHNCFGLWMQDFRRLVDLTHEPQTVQAFRMATDLEKPRSKNDVEKNWFVFWDADGQMYTHHDILPQRILARQFWDGSVGEDLAPTTGDLDSWCLGQHLGLQHGDGRVFHQATNSLAITMCSRRDSLCVQNNDNTFILTIIQEKSYQDWHSVYEPYVVLFKQTAPFAIKSVSKKPIWIHGRKTADDERRNPATPVGQKEMLYVTSVSWRDYGQKYHGYLDDVLFLNFGVEDSSAGSIDVVASDLLKYLGECDGPL